MSTNPRNPRYFPTMKVRGARRRYMALGQLVTGSLDRFVEEAAMSARAIQVVADLFKEFRQRYIVGMESPAIVHQFESPALSVSLSPEGAYDETRPSERRTQ